MISSVRFQVLQGANDRRESEAGAARPSLAERRAALLSYEQLAAGRDLLRRVKRSLELMHEPASGAASAQAEVAQAEVAHADIARVEVAQVDTGREVSAAVLARDPRAHPVAPARPQRATRPVYEVVTEQLEDGEIAAKPTKMQNQVIAGKKPLEALLVEPVEPAAEPRHRGSLHGGVENPVRSMLSPSQRAALRRPETQFDRNGRQTYVTYTVDSAALKD